LNLKSQIQNPIARRAITPVFPAGYETQLQPDSCQYSVLNLNYAEQVYQLRVEPFLERWNSSQ